MMHFVFSYLLQVSSFISHFEALFLLLRVFDLDPQIDSPFESISRVIEKTILKS